MKRRPHRDSGSDLLRQRAEVLLRREPRAIAKLGVGGTSELVHELQIHQAELEMQNDELRRVQLDVEASRDRFAELFDFAPVGYLAVDPEGVVLDANLAAADIVGATRGDLVRCKLSRFIAAGSQDAYYLHRQQVFATNSKQTCELILRKADGTTCATELRSVVITSLPAGRRQCLTALSDITPRKHADATRAMLATIVETSEDAILSSTADGTITSWNRAAERLYGYTAVEILGRSVKMIVPPERGEEQDRIHRRILQGERIEQFETTRRRKDGRIIPVSLAMSPIRDLAGRVTGTSAISWDITQQKQLEEAMREREQAQALLDLFAESPLGLLFVDPKGRIERVNPAQLEMIGREGENIVGQPVADWFVKSEHPDELLRQLRGRETVRNFRTRLCHANGSTIDVLIDANGLWRHDLLQYTRWFVRDISQRLRLEREVLDAVENEQLRFGQDLHDDLCQQLTGIEFLCQRLAGERAVDLKNVRVRILEIAKLLRASINHARELARGLSPIAAEGESLMLALDKLADRTRKIFRRECRFRCDPSVILGDRLVGFHLYRIAQEAVSNAIRHGKARRITIDLAQTDVEIVLCVKDKGIGLPRKVGKQQGMGLRIMSYRAGAIGASLVVRRRRGGGTEVVCTVGQDSHPHFEPNR